jgi:hypothetical protein
MDTEEILTTLKLNFPFFRMIFNFGKTGPAVFYKDSRVSGLRADTRPITNDMMTSRAHWLRHSAAVPRVALFHE